ncbi:hypothetical protein ABIC49_001480 [Burkholderia ambifaria]
MGTGILTIVPIPVQRALPAARGESFYLEARGLLRAVAQYA